MSAGTFIALYRSINVGGNNPVKMAVLRELHESLGHKAVKSYVQSGNVAFRGEGTAKKVSADIAAAFARTFGFEAKVMVRDSADWEKLISGNPYPEEAAAGPTRVHAAICEGTPDAARLAARREKTGGPERFEARPGVVYLHAPDGVGRSKFAAGMERACGVPATVRNWRTIEALNLMAKEAAHS
jgi:uncharacterized protein (DUF1697 family)